MNRYLLSVGIGIAISLASCAPARVPTPDTMMGKETPTTEAMMPKETPTAEMMKKETLTAEAMMPKETPTAEMMKKETPTAEAMMPKETPTAEMMKKETPTAEAIMPKETPTAEMMMGKETPETGAMMAKLPDHLRSPHFVDSAPMHGQVFARLPEKILINFNFDLHQDSTIMVSKDGVLLETGKATVAEDRLSMQATLPGSAGDGLYVVKYKACWPDRSCHEGQFGFVVDAKVGGAYLDMTGKAEVTIHLKDTMFNPSGMVVSKGTKVTWVNDDDDEHFINTDPHPTHNNLPDLNSKGLKKGDTYAFTFNQPGEWAYHCSAHTEMRASIIVE